MGGVGATDSAAAVALAASVAIAHSRAIRIVFI